MDSALITGATGFCGRHLVRRLRAEGRLFICGLGRRSEPPAALELDDYLQVDLGDGVATAEAVRRIRPGVVFHLAGLADGPVETVYRTNLVGTLNLLEALRVEAREARVLLVGSAAEYGIVPVSALPVAEDRPCLPVHTYGISKHAMTLAGQAYASRFGMKVVVARPFNIIGAGISPWLVAGAVLHRLRQALRNGGDPVVKVGNLETERDFVAVEDVVDAYVRLLHGEHWGEVFNICSGRPYRIGSLVSALLSQAPRAVRLVTDPALLRAAEVQVLYGSWEKAHRACGFRPVTSLEESIRAAWRDAMAGAT